MAKILIETIDLEKVDFTTYEDLKETKKYIEQVVKSIEEKVKKGERVNGLILEKDLKRIITPAGLAYLVETYGENFAYNTKITPIGITELEKALDNATIQEMIKRDFIALEDKGFKVKVDKEYKKMSENLDI